MQSAVSDFSGKLTNFLADLHVVLHQAPPNQDPQKIIYDAVGTVIDKALGFVEGANSDETASKRL